MPTLPSLRSLLLGFIPVSLIIVIFYNQSRYTCRCIGGGVLMVYVPYEIFRENMRMREPDKAESEIHLEWYKLLNWIPASQDELASFRHRFPGHRNEVQHRIIDPTERSERAPRKYRRTKQLENTQPL